MMTLGVDALDSSNHSSEEFVPLGKETNVLSLDADEEIALSGPYSGLCPADGEAMIVQDMNSLTVEERRGALYDLHGVADIEDDDPKFIEEKLSQLEIELAKISSKKAYYQAKATAPAYVCDKEFRLLFLRSDCFNARNAAVRIVRHFETKLELFGKEKLGRDIRLSDLGRDGMKVLEFGYTQWLPQRDRAGRAILCWTPGAHVGSVENRFRANWWGMMNALRDKETQKRGMVGVVLSVGEKMGKFDLYATWKLPILMRSLPTRFVAVHACSDNSSARPVLSLVLQAIGTFHRVRFRQHHGTMSECMYSLMTFGIPSNALPVAADGSIKTDLYLQRLEKRKKQEKESTRGGKGLVIIPGPFDVMLGRGKLSQENLGNLRYRNLIAAHQDRYEQARRVDKTGIADDVVQTIKRCSGRFLKEHYADYIEIPDDKAREKVSHSFRSLRGNQLRKKDDLDLIFEPKGLANLTSTGSHNATNQFIHGRTEGLPKMTLLRGIDDDDVIASKRPKAAH